ncbi:hypothetical protein GC722_02915 [Auraticoccus sp. F435]|uniref:Uncharacterized protein n=1 Tax=Auraticoccus cholistanensis TaxID=2656650 RepID=A0A6A9UQH3_9ACTN|nr:hypothetical protein [Auraticoccus cholistanensis]MVA74983.1 hypothetical protein [Auraticoccus cholistanensis]
MIVVAGAVWTLDISLILHDEHADVAAWHRELRARLTPGQRRTILAVKTALREGPDYPGGLAVYTAVLEEGVASVEELSRRQAPSGGDGAR